MLALGASQAIDGGSTTNAVVNCTIMGALTDTTAPPVAQSFKVLYQGQLTGSVAALFTCTGSQNALISAIHLFNTGATIQTVTLAVNGTASSNSIATLVIPANGWATYADDGWCVRDASGVAVSGATLLPIGLGTPSAATTALTATTEVLQGGTLFQIPTGSLVVGRRFRFTIDVIKTAAGLATWAVKVKYGTNGTTADAAIASWTSGTNTAAVDQAILIIEVVITALGSGTSATAACTAFYTNTLTNATGLGRIDPVPGSTAGFDSTAATPYFHVDITAGTSAVMTGVGMAEQIR